MFERSALPTSSVSGSLLILEACFLGSMSQPHRDRSPVPIVEMPSNAPPLENLVLPATLPEHVRHLLLMWAIGTPRTGNLLAAALRPLL